MARPDLFLAVERIARLVGDDLRAAGAGGVAAQGRCGAAFGLGALDEGHLAQKAVAVMADGLEAQPGGVAMFLAGDVSDDQADDLAAVFVLPGGSGKVFADGLAVVRMKLRIGMVDDPSGDTGDDRAAIDLDAVAFD